MAHHFREIPSWIHGYIDVFYTDGVLRKMICKWWGLVAGAKKAAPEFCRSPGISSCSLSNLNLSVYFFHIGNLWEFSIDSLIHPPCHPCGFPHGESGNFPWISGPKIRWWLGWSWPGTQKKSGTSKTSKNHQGSRKKIYGDLESIYLYLTKKKISKTKNGKDTFWEMFVEALAASMACKLLGALRIPVSRRL